MNYRKFISNIALVFSILGISSGQVLAISAKSKVTLIVVGEDGLPIEGADVGISFQYDKPWATGVISKEGKSDGTGRFSATGTGNGYIGYGAEKVGYYESNYRYSFSGQGTFGWKPWNPELTVTLRKVGNPVPMYARNTRESTIEIPISDKEVGFDLIAFDWVAPYGKGTVADFICNLALIDNGGDDFEYNLKIKFSNPFDGIQTYEEELRRGSIFKLPRHAPLGGYEKELNFFLKGLKRGAKMSWKESRHYVFRVRSEVEKGNLKRAMYGKILSDIRLTSAKKQGGMPGVEFKYYLNPDYTRNLEFDPNKNLFGPLPLLEQVGIQ